jgi:uncharacterized coiled-coil protein SlyX
VPDDRIKPDRRRQSQTERDIAGIAARRDRERQQAARGVPVLVSEFDDLTGKYDGEDLALARAKRPTDARVARLEKKQDEDRLDLKGLAGIVGDLREDMAGMRGELKVLPELLELIKGKNAAEHETKRHGMTLRSKVVLAVIGALSTGGGIGALISAVARGS